MKKFMVSFAAVCLVVALAMTATLSMFAGAVLYGDVNSDGAVNNKDLAVMQRYLAKWNVELDKDAADVNVDGAVNNKDLALLQRYLAKWDVTLGPDEPVIPDDPFEPEDPDDNRYNDTELEWN